MRQVTLFAEFRGRRYLMENRYARFPDAEAAGALLGRKFPKAGFYVTDREITCEGGDAIAFGQAYEEHYPVGLQHG